MLVPSFSIPGTRLHNCGVNIDLGSVYSGFDGEKERSGQGFSVLSKKCRWDQKTCIFCILFSQQSFRGSYDDFVCMGERQHLQVVTAPMKDRLVNT